MGTARTWLKNCFGLDHALVDAVQVEKKQRDGGADNDQKRLREIEREMEHRKVWGRPQRQAQLHDYMIRHSRMQHVVRELREETEKLPNSIMMMTPDQLPVLSMFGRMTQAERVVDLGTFTGISALQFALATSDQAKVITIDITDSQLTTARKYWKKAGVDDKIEARVGDGLRVLDELKLEGYAGKIDLALVDADKPRYDAYYEKLLTLVRPGGIILFDNVLFFGDVADDEATHEHAFVMRALNKKLYNDDRISYTLIPAGDGFAVCQVEQQK